MSERLPTRLVLALVALALLVLTKDRADSWADGSRMGTIQALVEQGTFSLDDTQYLWQGDRVLIDGKYYSHQPPMLALVGALPYAALHHLGGRAIDDPFTYRSITWFAVGLPVLLGLLALGTLLRESGCGPRWAAAWLGIAFFGSLLLPFSLVLNQHGTAAGLTMLALLASTRGRAVVAGALMSLAATVDLTAAFPALALAWPLARAGGAAAVIRYAAAALPVIALHLGINWALVGDLLPIGLHTEAFTYPMSPFLIMSLTGGGAADPAGTQAAYTLRALFGQSGLFSHHPALLLATLAGLALLVTGARQRLSPGRDGTGQRLQGQPRVVPGLLPAIGISALAIAAYYLTQSRNFGGSAWGMRWFCVFAPPLVLLPAAWQGAAAPPARRGAAAAWLVAPLALWSVGAAALGSLQPWAKIAWTRAQSTEALTDPGTLAPTWREHLRGEVRRVRDFEQRFDRRAYEDFYQELLRRYGLVHLREWSGWTEAENEAWAQEGIGTLHVVLRELERDNTMREMQGLAHFWLGKLYARVGGVPTSRYHLQRCLQIITSYGPALKAISELPPVRRPGG